MGSPIRVLTAVPICDGHDSAINTINLEFIRHGIEVVYLGYHRPVGDIVRAAIQEDVRAIGISSYNGGHIEFFAEVVDVLRKKGADDIKVFGGGGGTITHDDAKMMRRKGVDEIFFAGTSLEEMVKFVHQRYGKPRGKRRAKSPDQELAHKLTEIEDAGKKGKHRTSNIQHRTSKIEGHRIHRSGRRRKNNFDRRASTSISQQGQKSARRDFIARSERGRRGRGAWRARTHDQFAK